MNDSLCPLTSAMPIAVMLEAIAVPAYVHQGRGIMHANPAMQRLMGRDKAALIGLPHLDLVAPEDRAKVHQASSDCLGGDLDPPACSVRLLPSSGGQRHVEMSMRRLSATSADLVLVTCVDHSDVHHVQSSLQAMSELLRQIVDGAPVASFVIDKHHRVTHWNSACERLTGHSAREIIGTTDSWKAFYDSKRPILATLIVDGADAIEVQRLYGDTARASELLAGAYDAESFFPNFGPAGSWLYFTAAPLRDEQGQVIGAIETLQDVSLRRRAEDELTRHRNQLEQLVQERSAELAASARELEAFIENAPFGVAYTASGIVQRSNPEMADMFGVPGGSAIGMASAALFRSPTEHADLGKIAAPRLSQGLPVHHEMWMRHASGRSIWVQLSAYVADHANTSAGTWWMLQDRTGIREAQEELACRFSLLQETNRKLEEAQNQLLQADKMASIGQLAAGVAHEINNPVGFVSSNLNTLRQYVDELMSLVNAYAAADGSPQDAPARAALQAVRDTVDLDYLTVDLPQLLDESAEGLGRVKKIVQDLKDFSRVDQSDWQEADLNAGLESTLNVVRHEVKYKAEVLMRLTPLPAVRCLAAQLNQVFLNLIVNASHAIESNGQITLSSGTLGAWAWVQVEDTGCGMSDEVRRRIFEPFYTTKDVGKGTGLGLSLSFSIIQKHGGAIQVRSTLGQGSAFRVWVPLAGPGDGSQAPASPPEWA